MPTFILAGVQRSIVKRVKAALESNRDAFADWDFAILAGEKNNNHDIAQSQVDALMRLAEAHGGAHIFGVSGETERRIVEAQITPFFRFRWLETRVVGLVGAGQERPLIDRLTEALLEELFWADHVKPSEFASPLTLPDIFDAKQCRDMWRLAQSYNNTGHLEAAKTLIDRFAREHRKPVDGYAKTPWLSDDGWVWDDNGERHGDPEFPDDWKYSFNLPSGFHFDVSPLRKGKTFFTDRNSRRHGFKKHLNITAHGTVRGADK